MSRKVKLTCDVCGAAELLEQECNAEFIRLQYNRTGTHPAHYSSDMISKHVCVPCAIKLGIVSSDYVKPGPLETQQVDIRDKLFDVLREMVEECIIENDEGA